MTTDITLDHPVQDKDREITTLTMRRPKVADHINAERAGKSEAAQECQLFADLCGVAYSVIGAVDMADYGKLQAAYRSFLKAPSTPGTSGV